jgi:hypothetical protein
MEARSVAITLGRVAGQSWVAAPTAPRGEWSVLAPLSVEGRVALRAGRVDALVAGRLDGMSCEVRVDTGLPAARAATRVLRYLFRPGVGNAPTEGELAIGLAAQHALRGFARRLPGFSESSPAYLYDNFLDFEASLEEAETRRICRIGRPPLGALLVMTGAARGQIPVPWLGGAPLDLYGGG